MNRRDFSKVVAAAAAGVLAGVTALSGTAKAATNVDLSVQGCKGEGGCDAKKGDKDHKCKGKDKKCKGKDKGCKGKEKDHKCKGDDKKCKGDDKKDSK